MVSEPRKQSMASMETDYSKHTFILSMEDIMAAGAFGMLGTNYGKFNIRYQGVKIWNMIPEQNKKMTKSSFKNIIKQSFLDSY